MSRSIKKWHDAAHNSCRQLANFKPSAPERNRAISYKFKKIFSVVSLTLCASIAFTLPVEAIATTLPQEEKLYSSFDNVQGNSEIVADIIAELTDKRSEFTKEFLLDDGTKMIAEYDLPVHFKNDEGNWVEYDNSLIADNSTADEATSEYSNKNSNIDIKLSNKAKSNNMIKVASDDYSISWGYDEVNKSKVKFIENDDELIGNEKFTTLENLTQEAMYEDVYKNVDLQYFVSSSGIKENIILKNSDVQNEFNITYKIKNLTAEQTDDYTITLYNKSGKAVYTIVAPYMTDAKGKSSTNIKLSIDSQKGANLKLKLSVDKNFIYSEDCEYPVTIDPMFLTSQNWQEANCTYVDNSNPNTAYGYGSTTGYTGTIYVGSYGEGLYRSYFKIKNLPALSKGDMIVAAEVNFHLYNNNFYDDMPISAHFVKSGWYQDTLNWNNQPSYDENVLDYETLVQNESEAWHNWDVTSCVKRWYNGEANNGIMLKAIDENNAYQCAGFYSSNYPSTSIARPVFTITYRNNKGLEDYWTYSSFSVGSAGTAYINDYSGNLVYVANDVSTPSNIAPATIQHVYNGYMAGVNFSNATPVSGLGWQMNINRTLLPVTNEDIKDNYPYVYADEDGTEHYFYKKVENGTTKYLDEDGLGLELTIDKNSTYERYVITDEKDNKINFIYTGRLDSIVDSNGNKIKINYTGKDTVVSVTDGSNKLIEIAYTTKGETKYLCSIKDAADRKTLFTYDNGYLKKVTYPNENKNENESENVRYVEYTYDDEGSLKTVTDVDGYKVEFKYTNSTSGKKVKEIQEYGSDGTLGQKVTFDRTKYNTTIIDTYGADGIDSTADDLTSIYQFDNWGRTISVKSSTPARDLGASVYTYTSGSLNSSASNIKQLNRVNSSYSTGSNPVNLISNSNMETNSNWNVAAWNGTNTFTTSYNSSHKYFGNKSLLINVSSYEGDSRGRVYQDFNNTVLTVGTTYTLSAYIKTANISNGDGASGAVIAAECFKYDNTTQLVYSDYVRGNTSTAIDNGWQRVSLTFTVPANTKYTRINLALRKSTGYAYFDGVQLEAYGVANGYNMLENAGFENYSSDGLPTGWEDEYGHRDTTTDIESSTHYHGSSSFRIKGDIEWAKGLKQTIPVSGTENDTYIVSGWAKANAVAKDDDDLRKFKISIKITYSNGTTAWKTPAEFNHSISDWQFTSAAFNLSDNDDSTTLTPTSITVCVRYHMQSNYVYFDDICLEKDNAMSYTYDSDGNLVSVVSHSNEQSSMEYSNSDLIKNYDAKGYAYTYDYDDNHNMTKATSQNGVTYNYTYDDNGLATNLEISSANGTKLKTSVSYNDYGMVTSATDANGNVTNYNYNTDKGTLTDFTDSKGVKTSYTYDEITNQITSVSKPKTSTQNVVVEYDYSDDSKTLDTISHNGTQYHLEYDEYGNRINSKVGTQSLASYGYNSNNGAMTSTTYGTGATVNYGYDAFGNVSTQKYNGTKAFTWHSDRNGNIVREKDYVNKIQYDVTYDTTGRLVRQSAKDTTGAYNANNSLYTVEYGYDLNNNVTRIANKLKERSNVNLYTYGKDNLLTKFDINENRSVSYTYDYINRLQSTLISTDSPIYMIYSYLESDADENFTTTILEQETIDDITYVYTYDSLGNITKISELLDDETTQTLYTFTYDNLNQLTEAKDIKNKKEYDYRYDLGGNITQEDITTYNSAGIPIDSERNTYTYSDTNWTDKLTAYNGTEITYDAIGNPLSYRDGMTMTWQNGRQLASLIDEDNNISYSYDSNNVRVSKTVNGTKYTYEYVNGLLLYETRGESKFYYSYDANGILYSVKYTLTDASTLLTYYFTHNSRGDIVGIYNGAGELRAKYDYDAWGNVLSVTDQNGNAITSATHIGNLNPFRYRGYYYDSETGLYYLMSRYYDPVTHRFINADGYFQTGNDVLDANTFAYCGNNPIMHADPTGQFSIVAFIVTAVAVVCTVTLSGCSAQPSTPSNYVQENSTNQNCYSYAFDLPHSANPGDYSVNGNSDYMFKDKNMYTPKEITGFIQRDMDALNKSVRVVDSPKDKLGNEYIVAMKTSTIVIPSIGIADYHFAVQLSDGSWADKPGQKPSRWNVLDGAAIAWDLDDIKNYYNTETVYFAIKR